MVCTGNMDRSPTAAMLLAERCASRWVMSASTEPWAKNQITLELVEEADIICAMEDAHQRLIRKRFGEAYAAKVIVLDIPANYICWEAGPVDLLKPKLRAALYSASSAINLRAFDRSLAQLVQLRRFV
jgi:predicted protein tyrosine phosphatase